MFAINFKCKLNFKTEKVEIGLDFIQIRICPCIKGICFFSYLE